MTVIRPNSISGVSSITGSGGDISIFRADGTAGDLVVNNVTTGIVTATTFVGNVTGAVTGSGANLTNLPAGNLTGTVADARLTTVSSSKLSGALPALDGSALTGVGVGTADSINTSGIVTATSFVPTVGQLSHRNLIINGDYRIAQRATSSTSNGYQTVDRWAHYSGSTAVTVTSSQQSTSSSDTPYQNGFSKFFRFALSGAGTANADAYFELVQKIEAQDIANSGWNFKSSSSNITLSFWLRASTNQTFHGFLKSYDGTSYIYAFSFTASGNNTWTKITKTIPGNSNLQFDNNNEQGLQIVLVPFYGTDYTNNRTLNTWTTVSTSNYFPDMASTWLTAGASTWDVTGFQLEVGPVATPFEHRSVGDELRRCYRYFQRLTSSDNYQWVSLVSFYSGSEIHGFLKHFDTMRAVPTLSVTTGSNTFAVQRAGGAVAWSTGIIKNGGDLNMTYFYRDGVSLGTSGQCGRCLTWTAGSTITLTAEL